MTFCHAQGAEAVAGTDAGNECSPLFWHLQNSVPEGAFSGTEYACRAQKGFLRYATRFLEALRAQNRLLGYGWDIRYRKHPPTVRDAFPKARNSRLRRLWTTFCYTECIFMMRLENLDNPALIVKGKTQPDFSWLPYSGIASSTKRTLGCPTVLKNIS